MNEFHQEKSMIFYEGNIYDKFIEQQLKITNFPNGI